MRVTQAGRLMPMVCLGVIGIAGCDGVPPTENPAVGLTSSQRLTVEPAIATLATVGESLRLQVAVNGREDDRIEHRNLAWSSADPSIVSVDAEGVIRSTAPGVTEIQVSYLGSIAQVMVFSAPKFAGIELNGATELSAGDTTTFEAYLVDEDGKKQSGPPVNWKSSNGDVASVSNQGLVEGLKEGETEISAKAASWSAALTLTIVAGAEEDPDDDDDEETGDPDEDSAEEPALGSLDRAFPGAEGYGALATLGCDRSDVQVLKVTNTNGSGSGSFRDALDRNDPKRMTIVVFETGGTIRTSYRLDDGCIYIAGQTAPGDGVQLHNPNGQVFAIHRTDRSRDIVVRHLRFRSGKGDPGGPDVLTVYGGRDIIIDHVSTQFGNDEILSLSPPGVSGADGIVRFTLQRSMVAVGLRPHSRGSLIVVPDGDPSIPVGELSIHHNLWAHSAGRNPSYAEVFRTEHINNVSYNWKGNVGMADKGAEVDYIGNYFKAGPWSKPHRIIGHDTTGAVAKFYARNNVADPFQMDPGDNQKKLFNYRAKWTPLPDKAFVSSRRARPDIEVSVESARDAYRGVLDDVGANGQVTCEGDWVRVVDPLDRRIIDHVRNGSGPGSDHQVDHPDDFVGVPHLAQGRACKDGDDDGMPDAFEERYGLNAQNAADASHDSDGDGYTNIEEYVNGTRPK